MTDGKFALLSLGGFVVVATGWAALLLRWGAKDFDKTLERDRAAREALIRKENPELTDAQVKRAAATEFVTGK